MYGFSRIEEGVTSTGYVHWLLKCMAEAQSTLQSNNIQFSQLAVMAVCELMIYNLLGKQTYCQVKCFHGLVHNEELWTY